jgi:hypothetical protein
LVRSQNPATIRNWVSKGRATGFNVNLIFWHMGTDPCKTEEGRSLNSFYKSIRNGDLGYFLEFESNQITVDQTTIPDAWEAFETFCGTTSTGKQGTDRAVWQPGGRNTLQDEEIRGLREEISRRETMGLW